jgi:tetratricopeptide (TPR) repeat protein
VATPAPAPTFEEAGGKAAGHIRAAQAAFKAGSYDRAVAAAQAALREDPANANARKVLENAQGGQKALVQLRAAEAALAKGDFDAADRDLEAARRLAPWDREVADFSARIGEARARATREAEARAQSARTTQINAALNQGATALQSKQYEAAIAAYEHAGHDPGNAAAVQGRQAAIGAKAIADAARAVRAWGRTSSPAASRRKEASRASSASRTPPEWTSRGGCRLPSSPARSLSTSFFLF